MEYRILMGLYGTLWDFVGILSGKRDGNLQ
jgi:hypothetical protein